MGNQEELASLSAAVDRLADRYRTMPESRLRRFAGDGLAVARALAAAAAGLEGVEAGAEVPDEGGFVIGDQIAVTGHDLVEAARGRDDAGGVVAAELGRVTELLGRA
ncbi:hypothetical protein BIV57_03615 [Mangrovactinospora gilvigrisea]|uniref:Uncharacterized protein n=1 Tax=Mangrovactinospora gilvigrisea TaxID=1428644 RepID=A0A1J7BJL6_9ACTN|nr:hypothetical protein [Mangrovactinospora gilvigrisea]OIV38838.1 hypothetical protein BIV57_03615 [Mangrovactinospora gilvigrisea]